MRNGSIGPRRPRPPIGKHLHAARYALRLTQEAFGAPLGVTKRTVSRWEGDHTRPSKADVLRIIEHVEKMDAEVGAGLRAAITGVAVERADAGVGEAERQRVVGEALVEMADALDVAPRRVREALVRVVARLGAAGVSVGEFAGALVAANGAPAALPEDRSASRA